MSKWEKVKIDDVCVKKIQTLNTLDDYDIEYVDISSVDNQDKKIVSYQTIKIKEAPSRAKQILKKHDILVSTVRPNLNAVAINDIESRNVVVGSTGYCVLRSDGEIETNYLFNFCKSKTFINGLVKVAKGASYPAVSNAEVKNSMIPLPPLEVQKQIAKTLDAAAELLAMRKQYLAELDNLIKSIFYKMFGDPNTNKKGWAIKAFKDVAMIDTKMTKDFTKYGNYPHIGIDSIEKGTGAIVEYKLVKDSNIISGKYLFGSKHIIYSKIRPNLNKVALPSFEGLCSADAYPILPTEGVLNKLYLVYILRSDFFLSYIMDFSSRTNIPKVNKHQLEGFQFPLPPFELQEQFANIVTKIEEQKAIVKKVIDETQHLYDSLMSQYFE
ncbi:restriction endonuclease subunit S [Paenibacillus sp. FSL H7-0350]|uniref:restriction endonuclease subunit S n=1 Tax=Paenibacillus sp. FSL H7-0350 TaxID=2975345 RepID=UPI0031591A1C